MFPEVQRRLLLDMDQTQTGGNVEGIVSISYYFRVSRTREIVRRRAREIW